MHKSEAVQAVANGGLELIPLLKITLSYSGFAPLHLFCMHTVDDCTHRLPPLVSGSCLTNIAFCISYSSLLLCALNLIQAVVTREDGMDSVAHRLLSAAVKVSEGMNLITLARGDPI